MGDFATNPYATLPGPKPVRYWIDGDLDQLRTALLDLKAAGPGGTTLVGPPGPQGPAGAVQGNLDGGAADSVYAVLPSLDGGGA